MAMQYFAIPAGDDADAGGNQAVMVPLNSRALVPMEPERVWQLRKHLVQSLRAMRTMKRPSSRLAAAARAGWLHRQGGARGVLAVPRLLLQGRRHHAYLDERVMARVRQAQPELDARAVMRLYVERVPAAGYAGSCVFHGAEGCTLDRSLRSDVCNSYFCTGLGNFVRGSETRTGVIIIAQHNEETRMSQVISP